MELYKRNTFYSLTPTSQETSTKNLQTLKGKWTNTMT